MKKLYCKEKGIKYLHGVEVYLTRNHDDKIRDNYHTILLAKNFEGFREINTLVSKSYDSDHFYYKPRISFDEFLMISDNVIKTSACLASPLNQLEDTDPYYEKLVKKYDFLEVQPHECSEQMFYNERLLFLSKKYRIPLIAGTDTHSINNYKAECRRMLKLDKHIDYSNEDDFDLTYKSCDELIEMFKKQGVLKPQDYLAAINNTNIIADAIEDFELDTQFKYPILYGSPDKDEKVFHETIDKKFKHKLKNYIIPWHQEIAFENSIKEECRVFSKIKMSGFMLFMSEMITWCKENNIPIGFNRGSCGGSRVAYVTDITDLNPEEWHTVFSRFCNEDRMEIGDIDIDVSPDDRDKVYEYIINRFGEDRTAYILAMGTISEKGTIDSIGRALSYLWEKENLINIAEIRSQIKKAKEDQEEEKYKELQDILETSKKQNELKQKENPYSLSMISKIKKEYDSDPEKTKNKYPDIFYYFDGLINTCVSKSMHPAGIVASPITLADNYGTFINDNKIILQIDMESVHEVNLVKYDILGLRNVQIIRDTYKLIGKPYPKSHEINWNDQKVWKDMLRSPVGIFQFESKFAFQSLKQFEPKTIFDMSLVTACIRPSGASYRDALLAHIKNKNPSEIIDDLLKENSGYLIYQEDIIAFLQDICGFSGSEADNIRRAIARKQEDRLEKALPNILEGYCQKSSQPREIAEEEAKAFIKIIQDASSYMFGKNHSIGYCMIGYLCAYLRYYYPYEFVTAYLNNADNENDICNGSELARTYGIDIVSPRFGISGADYMYDKEKCVIAKGTGSIKFLNKQVAKELLHLAHNNYSCFIDLLCDMTNQTSINSRQLDILIKLDYFSQYGNAAELLKIVDYFNLLKQGDAKQISKGCEDCDFEKIVSKYSSDKNKNGKVGKNYIIKDMQSLLIAIEKNVKEREIPDLSLKEKMKIQEEYLGYISLTTNKKSDIHKLLITEVFSLKNKNDEPWGYKLNTISICTGKTSSVTIKADIYKKKPVKKMDLIDVKDIRPNKTGYFYIWKYDIL